MFHLNPSIPAFQSCRLGNGPGEEARYSFICMEVQVISSAKAREKID